MYCSICFVWWLVFDAYKRDSRQAVADGSSLVDEILRRVHL